jgi:pSer/pThr/pTyr-binding forkhead associated (FHA) protein/multidrug resistance efflux pump
MSFGTVTVISSNGETIEELPLDRPSIRIGRSPENEIQLPDERVSRLHAEILCSPRQVEIIDMNSANGVRVNGDRLPPGLPYRINDGDRIEIGSMQLKVVLTAGMSWSDSTRRATQGQGTTGGANEGAAEQEALLAAAEPPVDGVEQEALRPAAPESLIDIMVNPPDFEIEAGGAKFVAVTLTNRSSLIEGLSFVVDGIPPSWVKLPDKFNLMPETSETRPIQITVPDSPDSRAGEYPCTVTARFQAQDIAQTGQLTVTVRPFVKFDAGLRPPRARGSSKGSYHLTVKNESNWNVPFQFEFHDADELLLFSLVSDNTTVLAGERRVFPLTARPKKSRLFGAAMRYAVTGSVTADAPDGTRIVDTQKQKSVSAELTLRPWPWWSLLLVIVPLLLIGAGLALQYWPEPDRIISTVRQGQVVQQIQATGRVVPSETIDLAFERDGVVEEIAVSGTYVITGQQIGFLRYYEQVRAVRIAEDNLDRARQELQLARQQLDRDIAQAKLDLERAEEAAQRVAPGGPDDPVRKAEQQLAETQRAAREVSARASAAKLAAEDDLAKSAEALQAAQAAYSQAGYELKYVLKHGTDPNFVPEWVRKVDSGNKEIDNTFTYPMPLNEIQIQEFRDRYAAAQRALQDAERAVRASERALEKARANEIAQVEAAQSAVDEAQFQLEALGGGSITKSTFVPPQRSAAQREVEAARLKLESLERMAPIEQQKAFNEAFNALQREREKLQRGAIITPQAGFIIAATAHPGDVVKSGEPVLRLVPAGKVEIAFDPASVMATSAPPLQPTMPVTVTLKDGTVLTGTLEVPPATPGSTPGGDNLPRVELRPEDICESPPSEATGQQEIVCKLRPDDIVTLSIDLQRSAPTATWAPPPFVVRSGDAHKIIILEKSPTFPWRLREREMFVRIGAQNDTQVEIIGFETDVISPGLTIVGR